MENMNKSIFTLIGWDPPGYGHSIPPSRSWPEHFLGRDAELAAKMMKVGFKFYIGNNAMTMHSHYYSCFARVHLY